MIYYDGKDLVFLETFPTNLCLWAWSTSRTCATLVQPVFEDAQLKTLLEMPYKQWSPAMDSLGGIPWFLVLSKIGVSCKLWKSTGFPFGKDISTWWMFMHVP